MSAFLRYISRNMSEKSKSFPALETNRHHDANTSWLEWKDSDVNKEKWGTPRDGPDGLFLDAERVIMPPSLEPYHWIRAKDLKHLTGPLMLYTVSEYPDLIANNKHLLHSEFVRWFISALTNLQYCGREGLEIGGDGPNFAWNSRHDPWHGWMHVYSLNKAGKGVQHRPVINPNGKYIVRLHCMGCWRRVLVDDTVPVDKGGRPLLPRTSDDIELWPMLLAKALLKVASLTWTAKRREIVDFHPIACLTGWTCLTLNIEHLSWQDKWDFLTKYSEHFEWTPRTAAAGYNSESWKSVTTDMTRKSKETLRLLAETEKPQPVTLFLLLRDMRELGNGAVPGLSPCWDHVIHVVQSRDVPLDPKDLFKVKLTSKVKPPLERWKLHRWLKWAVSQNIIDPADYFVPIRYLRAVSPLAECNESVVHVYDEVDEAEENSISPSKIEQSVKSTLKTKSQKTIDLFIARDEATGDASRWIDFNKMAPYLREVHLFYKLEYFHCSVQLTGDVVKIISDDRKTSGTKEIKKEKKDTNNSSRKIQKSRNKPLYLFCDSLEEKFFLIDLCAAPKEKDTDLRKRDYLILEKHNWFFSPSQSDRLVTISTNGTKSTVVELEAGRQLLRIYCHTESSLVIISSDTSFHLGDRATVQQLMTAESDRIEQMSKLISGSLRKAYQSFGTKDYPVMLKDYYRSYMPSSQNIPSREDKNFRMLIHHFFMEEQVRLIRETFAGEELRNILYSLRVFFLNPNIRLEYFNLMRAQKDLRDLTTRETSKMWYSRKLDNQKNILDYNQKATAIQCFFKMVLVKRYKRLHDSDHALHTQIRKELLKISDLFDSLLISQLLRNLINRHDSLTDLYPYSKDFVHVLNIQEIRGVLGNVKHDQWLPIARLVVNPAPSEIVLAAFELLIDLPRFTLRIFNNRDRREMTRIVNHVAPNRYKYHSTGYTMFAYGWSEKQRYRGLDWTIRILTVKGEPILYQLNEQRSLLSVMKPPKLIVEELAAIYVPNAKNRISRWILRATSGSIVSMRLTISYKMAEVKIKITDEEGNVLINMDGGFTVLLPLVILEKSARNKENGAKGGNSDVNEEESLYYVEALVLNNSWPLTEVEWMIVNQIKTKSLESLKTVSDGQTLEPPYWILQVVTDARNAVEVRQDTRREQEIALLKESWSKNPDRRERGKELREAFLNTHVSKIEPEIVLEQNGKRSKIMEAGDMALCLSDANQGRTLKPPDSHHLPALDLTKYARRDEIVENRWMRTESDYEILRNQNAINIIESQRNYSNYLENLAELMNKQLRRYARLFGKNEDDFWKGRALVDAAYESRKIYADTLISGRTKIKGKNKKIH